MSSQSYYRPPGLHHTPAYQSSGAPWITGSVISEGKVQGVFFPKVTKSVTLINTGSSGDIVLHFQSGSGVTEITTPGFSGEQDITTAADVIAGNHYLTIPANYGSVTMDVKCKELFVSSLPGSGGGGYQLFAELTTIETKSMYTLTGSGITE